MHPFASLAQSPLIFFLVGAALAQDQRSCYYPDGSLSLKDTPCTSGTNTTCCGQGFACLENGICQVTTLAQAYDPKLNPLINYYRGSCTDQGWSSPQCPQFCIGSQYAMDGGNSMTFCTQRSFCCLGGPCDCATNFNTTTFDADPLAFTTIGVPGISSGTSTSTSTPSSTPPPPPPTSLAASQTASSATTESTNSSLTSSTHSPDLSSPSESGLSTGAKIGIGIGVPAGVLAIVILGFLYYRITRQRQEIETLKVMQQPQVHVQTKQWSGDSSTWSNSLPRYHQRYPDAYNSPRELES